MAAETRGWQGHVIVCGLHGVGLRTIEQLRAADIQVVVVDDDPTPRLVQQILRWDVPYLPASAKLPETLVNAGLEGAQAVLVVEESELDTLEIALLVRSLRADVRIVSSMANAAVGRAVEGVTGKGSVLDVASLAAPSIVQACLQDPVYELEIPGKRFVAVRTEAAKPGRLRDLYGDLAPLAVLDNATGQTTVCPGRDLEVEPGHSVVVVGTDEEMASMDVAVHRQWTPVHPSEGVKRLRQVRRLFSSVASESDTALRYALGAAVVLVVFCATILSIFYKNPDGGQIGELHAVYFALATVATVGFGDYHFSDQSDGMVLFGIFMIISGAVTFTILVALLTNLLVGRRLAGSLGRSEAGRMHDHVVVIGLGAVGVRVVQGLLDAGRQVVVLERDEGNRFAEQVRALGVPIVLGDATVEATLDAAGVRRARAVAVLTSNDMVNIEAGLAVRSVLGETSVPVVLRVFDRQLGNTVRESLGMRFVRSTAELAAPWFLGAALGLEVLGSFSIAREHLLLGGLTVVAGGGLEGVAMGELSSRTRIIALQRVTGVMEYPPRRDTRFSAGDRAYIMGPPDDVLGVLRRQS